MTNLASIGLNQNVQFHDLTSTSYPATNPYVPTSFEHQAFLTAAGYAAASVLYDIESPAFIRTPYTIAPFEVSFRLHFSSETAAFLFCERSCPFR